MKTAYYKLIFFIVFLSTVVFSAYIYINVSNTSKYASIIERYCVKYKLDPLLVKAIIKAESNFNPSARSKKGAAGLMQIMPSTAKEIAEVYLGYKDFKEESLYEPETNIMIGACYVKLLSSAFDNNINLMLASYNAGIGNVKQWHQQNFQVQHDFNQMPFLETKKYVSKTKRVYKILKILDSFKILF